MRRTPIAAAALAALALSAPAWARVDTRSDHQKGVDFSGYATVELGRGSPAAIAEVRAAVEQAVVAELAARGLAKVDDDGDLVLVIHSPMASQEAVDLDAFDYGGRDWPGWQRWGPTSVNQRRILPGTLVVDLLDAGSGELVWRGIATDAMTGRVGKVRKKVAKAAAGLARDYPPAAAE